MTQEMCCCCGRPVGPCAAARPALPLTTVTPHVVEYGRKYLGFVAASAFICILHIHGRHCSSGKQRQAQAARRRAAVAGGSSGRSSLELHSPALCQAHPCMRDAFAVGDFRSANCPRARKEPSAEDPNNRQCQPICTSNTLSAAALQPFSPSRLVAPAILSPWAPAADSQACTLIASPHQ